MKRRETAEKEAEDKAEREANGTTIEAEKPTVGAKESEKQEEPEID